jgi:hypothetical protein
MKKLFVIIVIAIVGVQNTTRAQFIDSSFLNAPLPSNVILYSNPSNANVITTSVLSSVNLIGAFSNLSSSLNFQKERDFELIATLTGAIQFGYGLRLLQYSKKEYGGFVYINQANKNMAFVNMTIGGFTMCSALFNMIRNHYNKTNENAVSWNIYSFPTPNQGTGLAFSLSKKF